jgi:prepilin-type N-terminal cleavage/methylation domain-containing protein
MLLRIRRWVKNKRESGFSLIEAMVSTAIMSIGFVGVYTLVATSEQLMTHSIAREKAQMIADQMLEIISTDIPNISTYSMNLATCVNPAPSTSQPLVRGYEWCIRLNSELGAVGATDRRSITVTAMDTRQLVYVLIEGSERKVQVVMSRIYEN